VAGREGLDLDPYRELQVDPGACPEVIAAAFGVLREMVLRSDDDDAPRRLARLNAAHRTLTDPELRAAHDAGGWHLAQVNVALPLEPLDSPRMAGFSEALEPVNAVADASPGFVWRLQTEDGDATAIRAFGGRLMINMSVWESLEALRAFVYGDAHAAVLRRRREWFERLGEPETALWWVPVGRLPTVAEAEERLGHLRARGPSARAFTLRQTWPAPSSPAAASAGEAGPGGPEHAGHGDTAGGRGLGGQALGEGLDGHLVRRPDAQRLEHRQQAAQGLDRPPGVGGVVAAGRERVEPDARRR
jgi:heme-degrading monooxygenase HmoA